ALLLFYLECSCAHRYLHSFPTRRSSDLEEVRFEDRIRAGEAHPSGASRPHSARTSLLIAPHYRGVTNSCIPSYFTFNGAEVLLRSEEHTSELQSRFDLVCRLLLEKKKTT